MVHGSAAVEGSLSAPAIAVVDEHRCKARSKRGNAGPRCPWRVELHTATRPRDALPVLLVEDDAELRNMMETLFTLEGFEPEVASDGLEALEKLHSAGDLPEVIVLDMMMPRMDGWSFRRQQAREPDLADIPVVVFPQRRARTWCRQRRSDHHEAV